MLPPREGQRSSKGKKKKSSKWASVRAATFLSLCSCSLRRAAWQRGAVWFCRPSELFPRKLKRSGSELPVRFIFIPFHSYPTGFCRAARARWQPALWAEGEALMRETWWIAQAAGQVTGARGSEVWGFINLTNAPFCK